jgi:hypothetical protein
MLNRIKAKMFSENVSLATNIPAVCRYTQVLKRAGCEFLLIL